MPAWKRGDGANFGLAIFGAPDTLMEDPSITCWQKGGVVATSRKSTRRTSGGARPAVVPLLTLDVFLIRGPISPVFADRNPIVSRAIVMRGDQTLADLHQAIFEAFERQEERLYEFQLGRGPMDPQARRYVLPGAAQTPFDESNPPAGVVTKTRLKSLGLELGKGFCYWFDFGEDWWHQITVEGIRNKVPRGQYPQVVRRIGESPPQYAAEGQEASELVDLEGSVAADTACLIGELHLSKGDYAKAVEAFSRAIRSAPTPDAYEGRARAYRALAEADERRGADAEERRRLAWRAAEACSAVLGVRVIHGSERGAAAIVVWWARTSQPAGPISAGPSSCWRATRAGIKSGPGSYSPRSRASNWARWNAAPARTTVPNSR